MQRFRYVTIALLSITLLGLELVWTRIFSAEYFYAFAFLTLSLAVMGLGLGALALRVFPRLYSEGVFGGMLTLAGLTTLAGPPAVTTLGLDFSLLFSSLAMSARFFLALLALSSSFFFGGVALAYMFRRNHVDIPRLYMADLIGAGVGVLVAIAVMNTFGTPAATFLVSVPVLVAAVLHGRGSWKIIPVLLMLAALLLPSRAQNLLEVNREERAPVIYKHWDAMAKLKIYDFGGYYRGLNIDNLANTPVLPFDGDYAALDTVDFDWEVPVKYLVGLFDSCSFLSLGSGGGGDVLQALDFGAKDIYAVEVIPQINHLMLVEDTTGYIDPPAPEPEPEPADSTVQTGDSAVSVGADSDTAGDSAANQNQEPSAPPASVIRDSTGRIITCAEYTGHIYEHPGVTVVTEDARTFVKRFRNKFDIIFSWSSNSWAALASGSFALAENYIFTTEAFVDYWEALSDSGFLCMEHQMYMPRLVTEVMDALTEVGVRDATSHFAVYDLPKMRRKLLLLSKRPLDDETRNNAFGMLTPERDSTIHLLYPAPDSLKENLYNRIVNAGWRAASDSAKIDLSPCTDDRPFVAQLGLWRNFDWDKLEKVNHYADFTGFPLSKMLIVIILAVVIVFLLPLNLVPYLLKGPHLRVAPWLYFFAIGMAFMIIEVVLIQKYALFIGASVYSITTVLLTLLIASGIGSRFAARVSDILPFLGIVVWLILDLTLFGFITGGLEQLSILPRALVVSLLMFPLGFFMGMPFPKGTLRVGELVDWGFSVNGAASVFGATLAVMIAFNSGFTVALTFGGLVYLTAYLLFVLRRAW